MNAEKKVIKQKLSVLELAETLDPQTLALIGVGAAMLLWSQRR